jgi:two-component system chemotaxis response regulator CheY
MAAPAPRKILIVDDDALVRTFLTDALSGQAGYLLTQALDGDQAVAEVQSGKPEVVLLDLFMPKKSGLEALAEIRKVHPDCKVVVISSLDSEALVEQALKLGAVGFITKPFHPVEVADEVRRALASS